MATPPSPGLNELLAQAVAQITHDNNEAAKEYVQAIENWRQNEGRYTKPKPAKKKIVIVVDDSLKGPIPMVIDGQEPVCEELPDGLATSPPPVPPPGSGVYVDLGGVYAGSTTNYYSGPRDTAPDGYIHAPLGPTGPRWRKRVISGPFGNGWQWYELIV